MHTVLVTGFGPFPGAPFNPSGPLARTLVGIRRPAFGDVKLRAHIFPTSYRAVDHDLPRLIAEYHPDAILMFGLATRSRHVRIETQARNTLSSFPDASGCAAKTSAITPSKRSSLPIRAPRNALLRAARRGRIPARLSRDAGRYLCNYLYWRGLEAATQSGGPRLIAFIHIPNVRNVPVRKAHKRRLFSARDLATTGEAVLLALVSALKTQCLSVNPGS